MESEGEPFVRLFNNFFKKCHQELRLRYLLGLAYVSVIEFNQRKIFVSLLWQNFYVFKFVFMLVGQRNCIVFSFFVRVCVWVCVCLCMCVCMCGGGREGAVYVHDANKEKITRK